MSYVQKQIKFSKEELRKLAEASTRVVGWYAHSQYDGYHPGSASVRGPFGRWLMVEGGDNGMGDPVKYPTPVADLYDDAKFAAAAMNSLVPLLDENEQLEKELSFARQVAVLRGQTIDRLDAELAQARSAIAKAIALTEDLEKKLERAFR